MSNKNKAVLTEVNHAAEDLAVAEPTKPNEKLSEVDRLVLELAKSQRQTSLAEAKTALAQNEKSELAYKYVVLQLYMKYGLTERDAITEGGEIIKDGAVKQAENNGS